MLPVCPYCSCEVSLWRLWVRAHQPGSSPFFTQRIGIECPQCSKPMVVVKRRAVIISAGLLLAGLALTIAVATQFGEKIVALPEPQATAAMIGPILASAGLHMWWPAKLLELRAPQEGESFEVQPV